MLPKHCKCIALSDIYQLGSKHHLKALKGLSGILMLPLLPFTTGTTAIGGSSFYCHLFQIDLLYDSELSTNSLKREHSPMCHKVVSLMNPGC